MNASSPGWAGPAPADLFAAAVTEEDVAERLLALADQRFDPTSSAYHATGAEGGPRALIRHGASPAAGDEEPARLLARALETGSVALGEPGRSLNAVAPVIHAGRPLGALLLTFAAGRTLDDDQRRELGQLAAQAAPSVDRARLFQSEKNAREEAEILFRVAEVLNASQLDLETIVQRVTDEATRLCGAEFGAFFYNVLDQRGESYMLYTLSGAPKEAFARFGLPRNTPIFAPTFAGEGIVRLDDVKKDPRYGQMSPHHGMPNGHLPVTSYLAVPVISRTGEVLGGLFFGHSQPGRFTRQHERMTRTLAGTAALAIDNAKLLRDAREAAETQRRLVSELRETVRMNELFTGVLAHDLRAPVAAIVTAAELMRVRERQSAETRNEKAIGRVLTSGLRMSRMIEQLLDFTRLRVGRGIDVEPRTVDLEALVRQMIDELQAAHPGPTIEIVRRGDVQGTWDGDRLGQVFSNLIANALQHGSSAGVRIDLESDSADEVRVRVRNGGTIAPQLLPKVFEPLIGGEPRRDKSRGLGLGLFITQQIVLAHGGRVEVTSSEAEGTTFTVTLPRQALAGTVAPPTAAASAPPEVRDQLRESESRFKLLVEAVKDYAIFMLDPTGRIVTWNVGAARIKGYQASDIIGHHFSRFYPEEDIRAGKCERELAIATQEGRFEEEGWRLRKDGSRFWANVVITALRDSTGVLVGFAKVTRDLTERRRLQDEQVRLAKAEEAIRLRDEFLALASHELKTPVTVLQMQIEAMAGRADPIEQRRLQRAVASSERLTRIIDSLLDAARLATGQFALVRRPIDLSEVVARVIEDLEPSAAQARSAVTFTTPGPIHGSWDVVRMEQMLASLLTNAFRYGAGAAVEVSLRVDEETVTLGVRDHGPGIPESERGRIFERFERAVSMRHYGGLGLGLYLTRQIVSAHGGTIEGENAPDGGARFTVRLPLAQTAAVEAS